MEERKKNKLEELLEGFSAAFLGALRQGGMERFIGEKLLNYVGMLLVVLSGAFFLKYTAGMLGPVGKLAISLAAGVAVVGLGEYLGREERYSLFRLPLVGGGWIVIYYTAFAAHYVEATRIIESPTVGLAVLCVAAAGMIAHSLRIRSRILTGFAFALAYLAFIVTHLGVQSLTVCTVLALAGAVLVRPLASPELAAINLAGFYLNYFPIFRGVLSASGAQGLPAADFWYSLGMATLVHAVFAVLVPPKPGRAPAAGEPPTPPSPDDYWMDLSLSLSAVVYAAVFYGQTSAYQPLHGAAGLLALGGMLTALSALRGKGDGGSALQHVQAFLGAAVTALAVFQLDGMAERYWGFALAASVLGTLGLWLDRRSFERYALAFMGLGLLHHWGCMGSLPAESRLTAVLSLGYLGAAGYALAGLRQRAGRAATWISGVWLYGGLAAILAALWLQFQPAAFAVSVFVLALILEWAAMEAGAEPLRQQAVLLEAAAGLYCFCIDYGSNLPVLGPVTPRLLVTASAVVTYGAALACCRRPEGVFLGVAGSDWRRSSAWFAAGIAAFGAYNEFGPRLRLPLWGLGALALLLLGRRREEEGLGVAAADFRLQAYLLVLATAAEGVLSYLVYPASLLGTLGARETAIFWCSSLILAAPVFWPAWAKTPAEEAEERSARYVFAALSLILPALFIAKEADGAWITLGWTLLGMGYLLPGLFSGRTPLRLPGLALLGVCVLKALFRDLTGLALPHRVLSYGVLGVLLVLSSFLYVRLTKKEECHES
ncbi:MAG: hypothetical protein A2X36_02860 [Elusimicrobia bacterium GWA2_69_24]|nr:MAG: hypothetical protein A2X36_02860 [Elusimicrobia bacterium GWA2_69_24]